MTRLRSSLAWTAPQQPADAREIEALRARAWHEARHVSMPLSDIPNEWARRYMETLCNDRYGRGRCR